MEIYFSVILLRNVWLQRLPVFISLNLILPNSAKMNVLSDFELRTSGMEMHKFFGWSFDRNIYL